MFRKQDDPIGCADVVEHDVVIGPHLSDEQEGDDVGEIGGPEHKKAVQQARVISR